MGKSYERRQKISAKKKRDESTSNKILIILISTFVLIFFLALINRYYHQIGTMKTVRNLMYILSIIGGAGTVAGIIMTFLYGKGEKIKSGVIMSLNIAGISLFLGLAFLFMAKYYLTGVNAMFFVTPAVAILYLIYYIYQREFFNVAVICAGGGAMLWILSKVNIVSMGRSAAALIISLILLILYAVFLKLLKNKGGIIKFRGQNFTFMPKDSKYMLIYLTCALVFILIILGFLLGTSISYILMFILFAYLFVMAVYHIVKLM